MDERECICHAASFVYWRFPDKIGIFRKMLFRSKINSATDVYIEYELNIS